VAAPDFSAISHHYARARPTYPRDLFAWLASQVEPRSAWDCATGNGQAALGLAEHFGRVIATDVSDAQIGHAPRHPRVDYRVAPAESSGLESGSADLVAAAAAVHWFDLDRFFAEARRVLRPGGVLAIWTYHLGGALPPFDQVFARFYWDVLRPFFDDAVQWVDDHYQTLPLPGDPLATPAFLAEAEWTLHDAIEFVRSWSGTLAYRERQGSDPLPWIQPELARLWGNPATVRSLRWPLALRASRLGGGARR
jgi:ubiquinone/menaquinone biosynthesis C-methylase UbiE